MMQHLFALKQFLLLGQGDFFSALMEGLHSEFSGEPGVKLRVKQGDLEEDVILSPYYGDPSKISNAGFKEGVKCELFVPGTDTPLDKLPIPPSEDGGEYYAIYLTEKLDEGELVAINDVWGNYGSRMLSETEILTLYADSEPGE